MFLTPRMPSDDLFSTAAPTRAASPRHGERLQDLTRVAARLDAYSQRGVVGCEAPAPPNFSFSTYDATTARSTARGNMPLFNWPGYSNNVEPRAPFDALPPRRIDARAPMIAPGDVYGTRTILTASDLANRSAVRRDRRAFGRSSPYARPHEPRLQTEYYPFPTYQDDRYARPYDHDQPSASRSPRQPLSRVQPLSHMTSQRQPLSHVTTPPSRYDAPRLPHLYPDRRVESRSEVLQGHPRVDEPVGDWQTHPPARWDHHASPTSSRSEASPRPVPSVSPRSSQRGAPIEISAIAPDLTLVGQLCAKRNCYRHACSLYGDFCEFHKPSRLCKVPECRKCAKTGGYCISHGGGRRCQSAGCTKSAKEGGLCIGHGGGRRCQVESCDKAATVSGSCTTHAGEADR